MTKSKIIEEIRARVPEVLFKDILDDSLFLMYAGVKKEPGFIKNELANQVYTASLFMDSMFPELKDGSGVNWLIAESDINFVMSFNLSLEKFAANTPIALTDKECQDLAYRTPLPCGQIRAVYPYRVPHIKVAVVDGIGEAAEVHLQLEDVEGHFVKDIPWPEEWPESVCHDFLKNKGYKVVTS